MFSPIQKTFNVFVFNDSSTHDLVHDASIRVLHNRSEGCIGQVAYVLTPQARYAFYVTREAILA
jgi:hypothetical protein